MRNIIGKIALSSASVASLFLAAQIIPSQAQASVLVTVWNFSTGGVAIGDPSQQALPTNPHAGDTPIATFTYNGAVNWLATGGSTNFLDDFVGNGGGSVSGCVGTGCTNATTLGHVELSTSGFDLTSLFRIAFSLGAPVSGNIDHDDGISIYDSTNTTSFFDSSAPTSEIPGAINLAAGNYNLWYVEANGSPSVLDVSTNVINRTVEETPEPGTLALMAISLLSLWGFGIKRRKAL